MVAHRRAGKTVACVADLVYAALFTTKQDARFAYIAPQFNQAKDIAWLYIKRLTADIPGVSYNESELRAVLPNDAQVRLFGADNPDRLRGLYMDGVILDEYADMKPRVWGEIVRPLLADRKGWAAFIGTPKGRNEFYRIWESASKDLEWFTLSLKASQSGLLDDEELESSRKSMAPEQYEQEFECSFEAALIGAFYGQQLTKIATDGRERKVDHDPAVPVHTAWDLGRTDDTSIWWYQVVKDEIHVIDFHSSHNKTIPFYVSLIKSKPFKYGKHWLPHDARAKTLAADGKSIIQQMIEYLGEGNGECNIVPDLDVQDGIQAARLALDRCWFDLKCGDGVEALRQYQREWDEDKKCFKDKPLHDWTSHPADAFRYLAVAWSKEPAAEKPKTTEEWIEETIRKPTLNELWEEIERPSHQRI